MDRSHVRGKRPRRTTKIFFRNFLTRPGLEFIHSPLLRPLILRQATLEGWASVRGDGLQMGLEDPLQLPLHNGLEESISSLCDWDDLEGTGEGYRRVVKKLGPVRVFSA